MADAQPLAQPQPRKVRRRSLFHKVLAWGVHLYTAMGLVAAAGIAVLIVQDRPDFRGAFVLMLVATLIDATDGTLARRVRVKDVLPNFDGRRLDDLIDFLTYTCLPLLLLWRVRILPESQQPLLLLPLLASVYGFSQANAKTDDGYFLGFPSYWNLIALYLYVLRLPEPAPAGILAGFALLTFIPARYLYSTRRGKLNQLTNLLSGFWACLLIWVLYRLPADPDQRVDRVTLALTYASLFFPAFYLSASWAVTVRYWWSAARDRRLRAYRP